MIRWATAFASLYRPSFNAKTVALWRVGWMGFFIACLLTLQALALTHHHEDVVTESACNVCHVIQHQPIDEPAPPAAAVLGVLVLLFVLLHKRNESPEGFALPCCYLSRAPPPSGMT